MAQERSIVAIRVRLGRMVEVGQEKQSAWCLPGKEKAIDVQEGTLQDDALLLKTLQRYLA